MRSRPGRSSAFADREPSGLLRARPGVVILSTGRFDDRVYRSEDGVSPSKTIQRVGAGPDAEIVAASVQEPERFAELFDRHWADLHRFCVARIGDAGEDVAAEVFRVAFSDRRRFDQRRASARPWLFGIASNLIRRHHRTTERQGRALMRLGRRDVRDATADDRVAAQIDAAAAAGPAMRALGSLRDEDRELVLLHAWADLTYDEIAQAVGIPIGTVRSRLSRARRKLRSELGEEHDD